MILVLGIATNKLYRHDVDIDDRSQPYLVDIAAELQAPDGKPIDLVKRSIRLPQDAAMQAGAESVNKISTRAARRAGATQRWAVYCLMEMINEAKYAVSYGDMTRNVVASVIARVAGTDAQQWLGAWQRPGVEWIDLRTAATQICKFPYEPPNDKGGYRWPSRLEAAETLLGPLACAELAGDGATMSSAAWQNMKTDMALFAALRERGVIDVMNEATEATA